MSVGSDSRGKVLRFGIFELEAGSATLTRNGTRVKLQDQPSRVLLHLLEHPGDVVTREELHRALWPDDTFVDFDHGLNTTINKIRDALGDSASNPRFIETVPKKGYRFIAPVDEVRSVATKTSAQQLRRRRIAWLWASGVLLVASLAGALILGAWREQSPTPVVTPLTSLPGSEWSPSLSPDGDRVAFSWHGPKGDNYDIYVKQVGSEQMLRITSDPAWDAAPVWSPDGRWIAFARSAPDNRRELIIVPAIGGIEKKIMDFHAFDVPHKSRPISWGPDSRWLVVSDFAASGKSTYALYRVSTQTAERQQLTFPPDDVLGDGSPAVSPDGRAVAFVRRVPRTRARLLLLRLTETKSAAGQPLELRRDGHPSGLPAWTADGNDLVFPAGTVHLPYLAQLKIGDGRIRRLEFAGDVTFAPSISLRGSRMVFVRVVWDVNIWRHSIAEGGGSETSRWPGSSTYLDHMPRFSPDGRRVAFVSNRNGIPSLWVCDADGSNAVRLSDLSYEEVVDIHWMPDGGSVVANAGLGGYLIDARNGTMQPLAMKDNTARSFTPSRDGRWLYFSSKRTGRDEVWKVSSAGGNPLQITQNGGAYPVESPDARHVYFSKPSGQALWRVRIAGGIEEKVVEALSTPVNFGVTEEGIYFIPPERPETKRTIQFLRFSNGKLETIAEPPKETVPGLTWGFALSPDKRSILFAQLDQYNTDLMLVEGFR